MDNQGYWTSFWIGLLLGIAMTCFFFATAAYAHDDAILLCDRNLKVDHVKKLGEETLENGLLKERYDRNDDGVADIFALSSITGTTDPNDLVPHTKFPVFWQVDLDFNGQIDIVYVDIHGEGSCDDIKPYLDLNAPLPDEMFHGTDPLDPESIGIEPRGIL